MKSQFNNNNNRIRINYYIKVPQVKLIQEDGYFAGVFNTRDALKMAQEQGLDLVEVNPKTSPPICKIIDFGKFKYEEKKKQAAANKKQKHNEMKEITFRPNTDQHDLDHKLASAKSFLQDGNKVKFTVRFRGREMAHPDLGKDKLNWIAQELKDLSSGNVSISLDGRNMFMIISPK